MAFKGRVGFVGFFPKESDEAINTFDSPEKCVEGPAKSVTKPGAVGRVSGPKAGAGEDHSGSRQLDLGIATVSVDKPAKPQRRHGFLVSLDGTAVCGKCGERGQIPHHLSLMFWQFWTRAQLAALLEQIHAGERLAWLAHRWVRLQAADGSERTVREQNGVWVNEVINGPE